MAQMVSPCCGAEYTDYNNLVSECCEAKLSEEGLCYDCKEHSEAIKGFTCNTCDEFFEEPEKDYEFNEAAKEAKDEDRADEIRDMN
jgi:hypothetical protein